MNQDNYTSLEISRKLVEAGVVLETEADYFQPKGGLSWHLVRHDKLEKGDRVIPAFSMSELWRELPEYFDDGRGIHNLSIDKNYNLTQAHYGCIKDTQDNNPCNAMALLLIWVTERRNNV